jgi:Arginyl-tRNA synthetase
MISYFTELNKLTASINDALSKLGITTTSVYVGEPTEPAFGEITTNAAFVLAKTFKKLPYEIAKDFLNKIEYDKENLSAEIHPSGFINFRFTERFYLSFLNEILKNGGFGEIQVKEKKKIIIEHTSVNPNKALHVGHARNVVLGDTFYRLFKRLGHDVKVLNYIDDTGVQVADLIVGFKYLGYSLESDDKFDHYCGDVVYVNANKAIEENEELKKKRSEILKDLEEGGEIYNFAKPIIEKIVREQLKRRMEYWGKI